MKKFVLWYIIFTFLAICICVCLLKAHRMGMTDSSGKIIVPTKYDIVVGTFNGAYAVNFPFQFHSYSFKTGETVNLKKIRFSFDMANNTIFYEEKGPKIVIATKDGKIIYKGEKNSFCYRLELDNDQFFYIINNKKYNIYDTINNKFIFPTFVTSNLNEEKDFYPSEKNNKHGLYDKNGNVVVPLESPFDIRGVYKNYYIIYSNGYYICTKEGKPVINKIFDECDIVGDTLYLTEKVSREKLAYYTFDAINKKLISTDMYVHRVLLQRHCSFHIVRKNGLLGILADDGTYLVPPEYDAIFDYSKSSECFMVRKGHYVGVVGKNIKIPIKYQRINSTDNKNYFIFATKASSDLSFYTNKNQTPVNFLMAAPKGTADYEGSKYIGLVRNDGEEILPEIYKEIRIIENHIVCSDRNRHTKILNLEGKLIKEIPFEYTGCIHNRLVIFQHNNLAEKNLNLSVFDCKTLKYYDTINDFLWENNKSYDKDYIYRLKPIRSYTGFILSDFSLKNLFGGQK